MNADEYRELLKARGFHRSGLDREMFLGAVYGDYDVPFQPSKACRYCKREVPRADAVLTGSYWGGFTFLCHAVCRIPGEKREAWQCQQIDADCNDCRYFRATRVVDGGQTRYGRCEKYGFDTHGWPNFCSALPCFEHRLPEPPKIILDTDS